MRYILSLTLLTLVVTATWVLVRWGESLLGGILEPYAIEFEPGIIVVGMAVLLVISVLVVVPLLGRDLVRAWNRLFSDE